MCSSCRHIPHGQLAFSVVATVQGANWRFWKDLPCAIIVSALRMQHPAQQRPHVLTWFQPRLLLENSSTLSESGPAPAGLQCTSHYSTDFLVTHLAVAPILVNNSVPN